MEEYSTPISQQSTETMAGGGQPQQNNPNKSVFRKVGLLEVFLAVIILLLLFCLLNYFNILQISNVFPNQLGWLPRQQTPKNVTPTSISLRLCKAFPENYGKVNCHKAVETALADTKGTVTGIAVGPLKINPKIQALLKAQNQQMWYVDIELATPLTTKKGNVIKSMRIQIPVDGSKEIFRSSINI